MFPARGCSDTDIVLLDRAAESAEVDGIPVLPAIHRTGYDAECRDLRVFRGGPPWYAPCLRQRRSPLIAPSSHQDVREGTFLDQYECPEAPRARRRS